MNQSIFDQYTSTCMLAEGDPSAALAWGKVYFRKCILPHLPPRRETRILDCGCGYGRMLKALQESGYQNVEGVDCSLEQVQYAQQVLGLQGVICADAVEFLKGRESFFDVILILDVLEHLEVDQTIELLKIARKRMAPGGIVVIQVPNALCPMNLYRYLDITHQRAYSVNSLSQTLRLAGYAAFSFYSIPPLPFGWRGRFRNWLWRLILNPVIHGFMWVIHGSIAGKIFSGNFLAVVPAPARQTSA
ncbi:MAG: class I SAM-dependent methyltransferase [bacterium]|jgi:SAM-dependent methyltransferase